MRQKHFAGQFLTVCAIATLISTPCHAKKDGDRHVNDDNRPWIDFGSKDGKRNRGGHHDDSLLGAGFKPNGSGKPKKLKFRPPTLVRGSSAKIEFKNKASWQAFEAEVKLPIRPDTRLRIDDLVAAEEASVVLDLYRGGGVIPYASCDLNLYAIKFGSSVRKAEYEVEVGSRNGSAPRAHRGICLDPADPALPRPAIIPDVMPSDEVAVTVDGLPLVDRRPINFVRAPF